MNRTPASAAFAACGSQPSWDLQIISYIIIPDTQPPPGDAVNERKWDNAGRVTKTYGAGETINVDVMFAQVCFERRQRLLMHLVLARSLQLRLRQCQCAADLQLPTNACTRPHACHPQNHLGRMNVRVCPLDAKDEAACKLLER